MSEVSARSAAAPDAASAAGPGSDAAGPAADRDSAAGPLAISPQAEEKLREIEAVLDSLSEMWDHGAQDVPGWVGQEMTFGQMRLLFLLSKHGPSSMSRVAEWLGVGLPAASGIVERVERHGLADRRHRQDDRRVVECILTDQGHRLIEEIWGMRREVLRRTLGVLSEEELAQLSGLISIVLERSAAAASRP
jgi:DNA-binding MarR family transcriptional regulator